MASETAPTKTEAVGQLTDLLRQKLVERVKVARKQMMHESMSKYRAALPSTPIDMPGFEDVAEMVQAGNKPSNPFWRPEHATPGPVRQTTFPNAPMHGPIAQTETIRTPRPRDQVLAGIRRYIAQLEETEAAKPPEPMPSSVTKRQGEILERTAKEMAGEVVEDITDYIEPWKVNPVASAPSVKVVTQGGPGAKVSDLWKAWAVRDTSYTFKPAKAGDLNTLAKEYSIDQLARWLSNAEEFATVAKGKYKAQAAHFAKLAEQFGIEGLWKVIKKYRSVGAIGAITAGAMALKEAIMPETAEAITPARLAQQAAKLAERPELYSRLYELAKAMPKESLRRIGKLREMSAHRAKMQKFGTKADKAFHAEQLAEREAAIAKGEKPRVAGVVNWTLGQEEKSGGHLIGIEKAATNWRSVLSTIFHEVAHVGDTGTTAASSSGAEQALKIATALDSEATLSVVGKTRLEQLTGAKLETADEYLTEAVGQFYARLAGLNNHWDSVIAPLKDPIANWWSSVPKSHKLTVLGYIQRMNDTIAKSKKPLAALLAAGGAGLMSVEDASAMPVGPITKLTDDVVRLADSSAGALIGKKLGGITDSVVTAVKRGNGDQRWLVFESGEMVETTKANIAAAMRNRGTKEYLDFFATRGAEDQRKQAMISLEKHWEKAKQTPEDMKKGIKAHTELIKEMGLEGTPMEWVTYNGRTYPMPTPYVKVLKKAGLLGATGVATAALLDNDAEAAPLPVKQALQKVKDTGKGLAKILYHYSKDPLKIQEGVDYDKLYKSNTEPWKPVGLYLADDIRVLPDLAYSEAHEFRPSLKLPRSALKAGKEGKPLEMEGAMIAPAKDPFLRGILTSDRILETTDRELRVQFETFKRNWLRENQKPVLVGNSVSEMSSMIAEEKLALKKAWTEALGKDYDAIKINNVDGEPGITEYIVTKSDTLRLFHGAQEWGETLGLMAGGVAVTGPLKDRLAEVAKNQELHRMYSILEPHWEQYESFEPLPYRDPSTTKKQLAVGYGQKVSIREAMDIIKKGGLTQEEAKVMKRARFEKAYAETQKFLPKLWGQLDHGRKAALLELHYTTGLQGMLGYKNMIAAMRKGDWDTAAAEYMDSDEWRKPYAQHPDSKAYKRKMQVLEWIRYGDGVKAPERAAEHQVPDLTGQEQSSTLAPVGTHKTSMELIAAVDKRMKYDLTKVDPTGLPPEAVAGAYAGNALGPLIRDFFVPMGAVVVMGAEMEGEDPKAAYMRFLEEHPVLSKMDAFYIPGVTGAALGTLKLTGKLAAKTGQKSASLLKRIGTNFGPLARVGESIGEYAYGKLIKPIESALTPKTFKEKITEHPLRWFGKYFLNKPGLSKEAVTHWRDAADSIGMANREADELLYLMTKGLSKEEQSMIGMFMTRQTSGMNVADIYKLGQKMGVKEGRTMELWQRAAYAEKMVEDARGVLGKAMDKGGLGMKEAAQQKIAWSSFLPKSLRTKSMQELMDPSNEKFWRKVPAPIREQMNKILQDKRLTPADYDKLALILEPGVPTARTYGNLLRDIEHGKAISRIADNPQWAAIKPAGNRVVRVPDSEKYSRLGGMYVTPAMANELKLLDTNFDTALRTITDIGNTLLLPWKLGKIVLNPATQVRNIFSNAILADLGGLPLWRVDVYSKALKDLMSRGKYYKEAGPDLLGHGFIGDELKLWGPVTGRSIGPWLVKGISGLAGAGIGAGAGHEFAPEGQEGLGALAGMAGGAVAGYQGAKHAATIYREVEAFFKLAKYMHNRELGMSVKEARADALKWLFDYSDLPRGVAALRATTTPFATFTYKALPRVAEAAVKHPLRFGKYPAAMAAATLYALDKMDISERDWKEIQRVLPDHINRGEYILMPFRDQHGRLQFFDLMYILPWGDISEMRQRGPMTRFLQNPALSLTIDLTRNRNALGMPIWFDSDTPKMRTMKMLKYVGQQLSPSLTPGIGYNYESIDKSYRGSAEFKTPTQALASGVMGMKTTPINERKAKRAYSQKTKRMIAEARAQLRKEVREGRDKRVARRDFMERIEQIKQRYK